jgi:hypothetical protein
MENLPMMTYDEFRGIAVEHWRKVFGVELGDEEEIVKRWYQMAVDMAAYNQEKGYTLEKVIDDLTR